LMDCCKPLPVMRSENKQGRRKEPKSKYWSYI
jgi:hypothetical protein